MAQTILVVDDDPVQRSLLETAIARSGMQVLTAPGGQPALDLINGPRGELVAGPGIYEIEVVDADPRRVKSVRIYKLKERRERARGCHAAPLSRSASTLAAAGESRAMDMKRSWMSQPSLRVRISVYLRKRAAAHSGTVTKKPSSA